MDILTGEFLSSTEIAYIYWSVRSSSRREGLGLRGWNIVILASCEYQFIRVHENLVQHQSNYILISNPGEILKVDRNV